MSFQPWSKSIPTPPPLEKRQGRFGNVHLAGRGGRRQPPSIVPISSVAKLRRATKTLRRIRRHPKVRRRTAPIERAAKRCELRRRNGGVPRNPSGHMPRIGRREEMPRGRVEALQKCVVRTLCHVEAADQEEVEARCNAGERTVTCSITNRGCRLPARVNWRRVPSMYFEGTRHHKAIMIWRLCWPLVVSPFGNDPTTSHSAERLLFQPIRQRSVRTRPKDLPLQSR
jgi:hypothetical protein